MMISATKVVEVPETVVSQHHELTGRMPPPAPPADTPILLVVMTAPPAPTATPAETAAAEPAPTKLPKTGSMAPLVGLLGLVSLTLSLAIGVIRRSSNPL